MSQNINKPLSENKTWQAIGAYAEAKDEIARLAAENERLRKAGDAMYRYVGKSPEHSIQMDKHDKSKRDWLAAKEGRDAK